MLVTRIRELFKGGINFMLPRDEYEFYDEWLNRNDDKSDIGLEEYNDMRCIQILFRE